MGLLAFACGVGHAGSPAAPAPFTLEVEGEAVRLVHDTRPVPRYDDEADAAPHKEFRYRFTVTVADRRYFIRLVPLFEQTAPETRYVEAGFDGRQQYVYHRTGRQSHRTDNGVIHLADNGYLSYESVPLAVAEPTLPPLWLAFAAGPHLKDEAPPIRMPPLWPTPIPISLLDEVSFPSRIEWMGGDHPLIRRAEILSEGVAWVFDPTQGLKRLPSADPAGQGRRRADYEVLETMTVDGIQLPRRARFRQYTPPPPGQQEPERVFSEVHIQVTKARTTTDRQTFVPAIMTPTSVTDGRRLGNATLATYTSTNWPPFEAPMVQYAFRATDADQKLMLASLKERQSWPPLRLTFLLVVTATVALAIVHRLRKTRHPE
ncbi:MAG: hypothetical protein D6766_13935 [Verrucomicrobia bacterium]|nr:MAG: hypothetical protein D6766_13935 [Verrucomicrobiota bacterium]